MSGEAIAFLVCAIVCAFGFVGAILRFAWRHQHPFSATEIEQSNWFTRWIKVNYNLFMWMVIIILLLCTIAFFSIFATSLNN